MCTGHVLFLGVSLWLEPTSDVCRRYVKGVSLVTYFQEDCTSVHINQMLDKDSGSCQRVLQADFPGWHDQPPHFAVNTAQGIPVSSNKTV